MKPERALKKLYLGDLGLGFSEYYTVPMKNLYPQPNKLVLSLVVFNTHP